MPTEALRELASLLRRRLDIIADTELRDRDPEHQLALLREVSETIEAFHARHRGSVPPRLNHYLGNCSYQKALEWAEAELAGAET